MVARKILRHYNRKGLQPQEKQDQEIHSSNTIPLTHIVQLHKIAGISKTLVPGTYEFTIHVGGEYDYRFVSER